MSTDFRLRRFHSLPCGIMKFHCTLLKPFLESFRMHSPPSQPIRRYFARYGWCHWPFQFSPRIWENFFVFFVIRIVKTNSSQFPSKIELLLLFCPFLLFSILSGFTYFRPYFWPYMIWSGSPNVCQSPLGPHSFWNFCFNEVKFVNPFHGCDKCLFE